MQHLNLWTMNWVDYCFLAFILISMIFGYRRGFVSEVISLVVWVLALVLPITFSPMISPYFDKVSSNEKIQLTCAFALIFIVVFIIGFIIKFLLKRVVKMTGMSPPDKFFGVVFGLFRGVALLAVFVTFINLTAITNSASWKASEFVPRFDVLISKVLSFIPTDDSGNPTINVQG